MIMGNRGAAKEFPEMQPSREDAFWGEIARGMRAVKIDFQELVDELLDAASRPEMRQMAPHVRLEVESVVARIDKVLERTDGHFTRAAELLRSGAVSTSRLPSLLPAPLRRIAGLQQPAITPVRNATVSPVAAEGKGEGSLQLDGGPRVFLPARLHQFAKHVLNAPGHTVSHDELRILLDLPGSATSAIRRLVQRLRNALADAGYPRGLIDTSRRGYVRFRLDDAAL